MTDQNMKGKFIRKNIYKHILNISTFFLSWKGKPLEIYAACINGKDFISKIHKEHLQIRREKREHPVERRVRK